MKTDPKLHERWLKERDLCRTNLYFLCRVLGYKDVNPDVHGNIVGNLQQFKGGFDHRKPDAKIKEIVKGYKPEQEIWELEGIRKNLFLVSRGFLKSSIITIAHTIQWLLNYPNVSVLIVAAVEKQAEGFLREIKGHFQFTEYLRWLFPDYCPHGNVADFGNANAFTVPCRTVSRKEPSVFMVTLTSTIASFHCDVVKIDDLVDKENVKTAEQIEGVKSFFAILDPLVQNYSKPDDWPEDKVFQNKGWQDLTGTIYHFSDLHYTVLEDQRRKKWDNPARQWRICLKSAAPNYPNGPAAWPNRYPMEALQAIELDPARGPAMLWAQYLLKPMPDKAGLVDSKEQLEGMRVNPAEMALIHPRCLRSVTVDLGGMEKSKADNDDTVINYHGFGTDGRLYIFELIVGKFPPEEVIDHIFTLFKRDPQIQKIKISKDALARVLMPWIKRKMPEYGVFLPLEGINIDNQLSKEQKIKSLQPYIANDALRFGRVLSRLGAKQCEEIWHKTVQQALFFPKYVHDDIWDTIADAMFNKDGSVTSKVQSRGKEMPKYKTLDGFGAPARISSEGALMWEQAMPEPIKNAMKYQEEAVYGDDFTGL